MTTANVSIFFCPTFFFLRAFLEAQCFEISSALGNTFRLPPTQSLFYWNIARHSQWLLTPCWAGQTPGIRAQAGFGEGGSRGEVRSSSCGQVRRAQFRSCVVSVLPTPLPSAGGKLGFPHSGGPTVSALPDHPPFLCLSVSCPGLGVHCLSQRETKEQCASCCGVSAAWGLGPAVSIIMWDLPASRGWPPHRGPCPPFKATFHPSLPHSPCKLLPAVGDSPHGAPVKSPSTSALAGSLAGTFRIKTDQKKVHLALFISRTVL